MPIPQYTASSAMGGRQSAVDFETIVEAMGGAQEDGTSASFAPGGEPVITTANPVAGQPMDISFTALNATSAFVEIYDTSNPSVTLASVTVPL